MTGWKKYILSSLKGKVMDMFMSEWTLHDIDKSPSYLFPIWKGIVPFSFIYLFFLKSFALLYYIECLIIKDGVFTKWNYNSLASWTPLTWKDCFVVILSHAIGGVVSSRKIASYKNSNLVCVWINFSNFNPSSILSSNDYWK